MDKHSVLKRWALISFIAMGLMAILALTSCALLDPVGVQNTADAYARDNTVLIFSSKKGYCTGVKIHSWKTDKFYVLTAAHCADLVDGVMLDEKEATQKNGNPLFVLEINEKADLLLLQSPYTTGLRVANSLALHERVHTMGWGALLSPHRSDGEVAVLGLQVTIRTTGAIHDTNVVTAAVQKGSSGGALLNEQNDLVGIVSATNPDLPEFSFTVPVDALKTFLGDR